MSDKDRISSPSSIEICDHFWEYFNALRENENKFAQAVTSVEFADGTVTVTIDPQSAGADREALYGAIPGSWERWAGVPVSFWTKKEIRLRNKVHSVRLMNIDGTLLGSGSTEQFSAGNHPDILKG